jgi:putative SOS response-associated peptidase YedK
MCAAYGFTIKEVKELYKRFDISGRIFDFSPRYNVRIAQMNPVIYMTADGVQIKNMYWSFLPSWAKEKRLKFSTFNARDDRLRESMYKAAIPRQRCIIPATHFFEPDKVNFPNPPHPWYCFRLKGQQIFALSGLYNIWTDPQTDETLHTWVILNKQG